MLIKITFYIYTVYSLIIHSLYLSNDKLINDNHTGWLNPGDILASLYNHLPVLFDNSQSVVHLCFLISHLIQAAMFMCCAIRIKSQMIKQIYLIGDSTNKYGRIIITNGALCKIFMGS